MSKCIGFVGCQAERHKKKCSKFNQTDADLEIMVDAIKVYGENFDDDGESEVDAFMALNRLILGGTLCSMQEGMSDE